MKGRNVVRQNGNFIFGGYLQHTAVKKKRKETWVAELGDHSHFQVDCSPIMWPNVHELLLKN